MTQKIYAVDFDDTLTKANLSTYTNEEILKQEPRKDVIDKVKELFNLKHKIIIHTARPYWQEDAITLWLQRNEVPFNHIVCGKLYAHCYIDDRAIHPDDIDKVKSE